MKNLAIILIVFIMGFGIQTISNAEDVPQERAIVLFDDLAARDILEEMDIEVIQYYQNIPAASILASAETLSTLRELEDVASIEIDKVVEAAVQTTGWGIPLIQTPLSWDTGYNGKGIKIGIIDSGISPHPDLRIAGGVSMVDYTSSYYDDNGHGTHVAGIIGALDNTIGIKGVAPAADLYAIKVFSQENSGFLSEVISGIDWGITNKMDVLNLSLGAKSGSLLFQDIIRKAHAQNITVVAAAGNRGFDDPTGDMVDYPARYSEAIAVAAVDYRKQRAIFSAAGPAVDIAAPGVSIRSTYLHKGYMDMSGTSMAAPFVAGQAALVKQAYPGLTNNQIRTVLFTGAIDLGVAGIDPVFGNGLLQAQRYSLPVFGKTATLNPATSIVLKQTALTGIESTTHVQNAAVKLTAGEQIDITNEAIWKSSNPAIATVSKGTIKLLAPGNAVITILYNNVSAKMDVTVKPAPEKTVINFIDIPSDYWAYSEIQEMVDRKVVKGYPDSSFQPESFVKRANAAVMLDRSMELIPQKEYSAFADVPVTHPYFNEIKAVQQADIFSGTDKGFNPSGELTRAQMAKVLTKAFNLTAAGSNPFPDAQVHWAKEYIDILYTTGITTGSNGKFEPERKVKRSEFTVFMSRAMKWQAEQNQQ